MRNSLNPLLPSVFAVLGLIISPSPVSKADSRPTIDAGQYRELSERVRQKAAFRVGMPSGDDLRFSYELKLADPMFKMPTVNEVSLGGDPDRVVRNFWDKISLQDGSVLKIGGENVPLTCLFVRGQDNRLSQKDSPLIPDFVLKVYLVANDFTCTGPINPGWPGNGQKKETWDTYVYFEIRDPTIMLPTETKIRYRWNEFQAVLIDSGGGAP